jgi:carboxymethylenebutenolidase
MTDTQEIVSKVVSKVPDAQVMSDLDSAAAWAVRDAHGDIRRLAIAGFCWGGRIVWLYAAHNPKLKAGAAWYGKLEGDTNALTPRQPLGFVGALKAPVIAFFGGKDTSIPQQSVDKMKIALRVTDDPSQIVVYPEAGHGFNADYRPTYDAEAAKDSWKKMLAWFDKYNV